MTAVALSGYLLDEALTELERVATDIENARTSARRIAPNRVPVAVLEASGALVEVPTWLREQKIEPITVMRDLAYLLDDTGSTTTFESTGTDLLADARTQIGQIYADTFADIDDIDSPEDREAMMAAFEAFEAYADDPVVSAAMLDRLGADGLNDALYSLQGLIATDWNEPNYYATDKQDEVNRLQELQDMGASVLATATASASSADLLDEDFGTEFVNSDARGWGVATLFQYADLTESTLGTDFLVDAGGAILQREQEQGGPDTWWGGLSGPYPPLPFGTDQGDDEVMNDPGLQWLQALDSNPEASQVILADENRLEYLLGERQSIYEDPPGWAAGRALDAAADLALTGTADQQETAAGIATRVVEHFGDGEELLDGADPGVASMISIYIADMDRVITRTDSEGGVYRVGDPDSPPLPAWLDATSIPGFGIDMDRDQLRALLQEVGDNEEAASTIAGTAGRYDQVRLDHAAGEALTGPGNWTPQAQGDPLLKAVNESAEFQGHLIDSMVNGNIDSAQDLAAERQRLASLFTLPIDYVTRIPGAGEAVGDVLADPIGKFLYGQLTTGATSLVVGDGVSEAMSSGNSSWDTTRGSVRLQSLYALINAETEGPSSNPYAQTADGTTRFDVGADLLREWPTEGGQPVPPGDLDAEDIELLLDLAEQSTGYAPAVGTSVDTAFDSQTEHWSGNQ